MRTIPSYLEPDLGLGGKMLTYLLKVKPIAEGVAIFGLTSCNRDVIYDDLSGDGPITYRAATGFSPFDLTTKPDLSVDSTEASALMATYPIDGMTPDGIARGDYACARFVQYLVNYAAPDVIQPNNGHGHVVVCSGQLGQITQTDKGAVQIELRSLTQILKQNSIIELTSITCRAQFGDIRCKLPLVWTAGTVASVGDEVDRTFVATIPAPITGSDHDGFYQPGVWKWLTGDNANTEQEIEEYIADPFTFTLSIPTPKPIQVGDTGEVRRDCDKSKAMCIDYGNLLNMRAEPEMPRANGASLQLPDSTSGNTGQ